MQARNSPTPRRHQKSKMGGGGNQWPHKKDKNVKNNSDMGHHEGEMKENEDKFAATSEPRNWVLVKAEVEVVLCK